MAKIGSATVFLTGDLGGLNAALGQAHRNTQRTIGNIQNTMNSAGRTMTRLGVALAAPLTASVMAAADFDSALTKSTSIMTGLTDEMRSELATVARQMSLESTFSAKQLGESYYFLAAAGLDAKQSIAALPAVTKFAQAGAFDLARATDLLTDAQSALGLSSKNAGENMRNMAALSDVLIKANTLANASAEQFSEALTNKAAAALRVANKSMEEGVAVLAVFADRGLKGAAAGERLSIILRDLPRAVANNSKAFADFGIEITDASGNLLPMADVVERIDARMSGLSDTARASMLMSLGMTRGLGDAIVQLSGSADQIRKYQDALNDAAGTTKSVSDKQLESFNSKLAMLKNQLLDVAITVGDQLIPALTQMAADMKPVLGGATAWVGENQKLTLQLAGLAAVLVVGGPLLIGLSAFIGALVKIVLVSKAVLGAIGGIGAAGLIGSFVGLAALLETFNNENGFDNFLSRIVAKIPVLGKSVEWLTEKFSDLWDWMKRTVGAGGPTGEQALGERTRQIQEGAESLQLGSAQSDNPLADFMDDLRSGNLQGAEQRPSPRMIDAAPAGNTTSATSNIDITVNAGGVTNPQTLADMTAAAVEQAINKNRLRRSGAVG